MKRLLLLISVGIGLFLCTRPPLTHYEAFAQVYNCSNCNASDTTHPPCADIDLSCGWHDQDWQLSTFGNYTFSPSSRTCSALDPVTFGGHGPSSSSVSLKNNSQESIFVVISDPLKDYH